MADNTRLNPGASGDLISTDDLGSVKVQRVKVQHGADGSATDVSAASPMPVDAGLQVSGADVTSLNPVPTDVVSIVAVEVIQTTHNDLNCNANLQVGDADVTTSNAVPITNDTGNLTVDATDLDIRDLDSASDSVEAVQATHDSLNCNANLQVADVDVSTTNAVPITNDTGNLTVDATDLDIRDLDSASDSVEAVQATHNSLNCNANLQIDDSDAASDNPVPVYDKLDWSAAIDANIELNDETSTALEAAGGIGVRHHVDSVTICNASASNAIVAILTASTVLYKVFVASGGGSIANTFPTALRGGDNEAINAQVLTSGFSETTPDGIYVNVSGFTD
tara:strand:+ start:1398 stop:2408 length:1011 start_codon:yes stop_codon:yes gene_type:complete